MRTSKSFTKSDIEAVLDLWEDTNINDICKKLDMTKIQVYYLVSQIRKAGYPIIKKTVTGQTTTLIKMVLAERHLI